MTIPLVLQTDAKPDWLRIRPGKNKFSDITRTIHRLGLVTVCEEAHCPNQSECWSKGTATFMVLGDTCTRGCRFCSVKTGFKGQPIDSEEPFKLAKAIKAFGLDYVVITSVDRDDLFDQGASHFAECIAAAKKENSGLLVEVLTPDFRGKKECIQTVLSAGPEVFGHNIETVKRLQKSVRDNRANYEQSLGVLKTVKELSENTLTKSSLMLGLGETEEEIFQTLDDLREVGVDVVTFGQYLRPTLLHLGVQEYVRPEVFEIYRRKALDKGFLYCASGPLVRSSYKAGEYFIRNTSRRNQQNSW